MEWSVVRVDQLSSLAARARLQMRSKVESHYNLPLEETLGYFGQIIQHCSTDNNGTKFEIAIVASGERACACISSGEKHTLVLDLGFVELIGDFLMVLGQFGDSFPIRIDSLAVLAPVERYWPVDAERQAFKRLVEREKFGLFWEIDEAELPAEAPESDTEIWGSLDEDDAIWHVTGSQIFRDVARKIADAVADRFEHPEIFDAFIAWPVHHNGQSYPASCALFNHIMAMGNAIDEKQADYAGYFHRQMVTGSTLILLHEVSHALHEDDKVSQWLQSNEARNIRLDLELRRKFQKPGGFYIDIYDRLIAAFDSPKTDDFRASRAVYETFFDIRALEMFLAAHRQFFTSADAGRFLAVLFDAAARNVALLTFKEQIIVSLTAPERMNSAGDEALMETTKRQLLLASYFCTYIQSNLPSASVELINQQLSQSLEETQRLYGFFSVDMLNGLPIFVDDEADFREESGIFWQRFIAAAMK